MFKWRQSNNRHVGWESLKLPFLGRLLNVCGPGKDGVRFPCLLLDHDLHFRQSCLYLLAIPYSHTVQ